MFRSEGMLLGLMSALVCVSAHAAGSYEVAARGSESVTRLEDTLRPFLETCTGGMNSSEKALCAAMNRQRMSQLQTKLFRYTVGIESHGPLQVEYVDDPSPALRVRVRGCLTCDKPLMPKGDRHLREGHFFVLKQPRTIRRRSQRSKHVSYDLIGIDVSQQRLVLDPSISREIFESTIRPRMRLELLYRPVSGLTRVGSGRHPVVSFDLVGYRVYNECSGEVYASAPKAQPTQAPIDRIALQCPAKMEKHAIVGSAPYRPSRSVREKIRAEMVRVSADLDRCYDRHGDWGDTSLDLLVGPDGAVRRARMVGPLRGRPVAKCVEQIVETAELPQIATRPVRIRWPLRAP